MKFHEGGETRLTIPDMLLLLRPDSMAKLFVLATDRSDGHEISLPPHHG